MFHLTQSESPRERCPACDTKWEDHPGIERTCRRAMRYAEALWKIASGKRGARKIAREALAP